MQLHQLKPIHKPRKRKRIGRAGKRGVYSGRGQRGQKARAGRKLAPVIRELIKRYPKLRGYRFGRVSEKPAIVNLEILEKKFQAGDKITPEILLQKKIVPRIDGKIPEVKILGRGKITKALIIENCQVSKSAKETIEKAGGKV